MRKTRRASLDKMKSTDSGCAFTMVLEDADDGVPVRNIELVYEITGIKNISESAINNSLLIACLFSAMKDRRSLHVTGAVSRRLLENLEEFQRAFNSWAPDRYSVIEMTAEEEILGIRTIHAEPAIAAFSGGVDAAFTIWSHLRGVVLARPRNIKSVLMVQGFDILPHDDRAFSLALAGAERMLEGLGLQIYTIRTDMKYRLLPDWEYSFGAGLASCLHLFSDAHVYGLMGSDEPYNKLIFPWGNNPVTNHLLSTRSFDVTYDGGSFTRTDKIAGICDWQNGVQNLRVCWEGDAPGRNCGKCEKCIRTILNFRAAGLDKPSCFATDVSDEQIKNIPLRNPVQRSYLEDILKNAHKRNISDRWVEMVAERLTRS